MILGAGCGDTRGLRGACLAILSYNRDAPDLMLFHPVQATAIRIFDVQVSFKYTHRTAFEIDI